MGHGIAQVCAMAGYRVRLTDADPEGLKRGVAAIARNLAKGIERGKVTEEERDAALARLSTVDGPAAVAEDADIVFEAIPEKLDLKQGLFRDLEGVATPGCIFATNTSSLSISRIAEAVSDPGRVIGTHFFNPAHIMKLLEVVVSDATRPAVLDAVRVLGERIGKEVITVRDVPGFATSRLGICLGMEAIRMVEQGVASAEDIDKAMVHGYRHPVGPLRLGDLVGLDVRMAVGEYLSRELNNPAFEPPALLREMVARGDLG
ncbi:MAG: 3-hydroxyacyl-CoA dehydrogenase family protein, partial [Deltaproteobacteria bacterium]|nr:3-hydroxyacyl-CoA dehydrogenase family protein [Deltaproteobacteria bacterium]